MSELFLLKAILKAAVLPPGGPFLFILGGLLVRRRRRRLGTTLAAGGLAMLLAFSLPVVANALWAPLLQTPPLALDDPDPGAGAIVLLTGGIYERAPEYGGDTISRATLFRARYAAALHRRLGLPILVTGGRPLGTKRSEAATATEVLRGEWGVPVRWIEETAENTRQNARQAAAILDAEGIGRVLLVTDLHHMRRARLAFEQAGLSACRRPPALARRRSDGWISYRRVPPCAPARRRLTIGLESPSIDLQGESMICTGCNGTALPKTSAHRHPRSEVFPPDRTRGDTRQWSPPM